MNCPNCGNNKFSIEDRCCLACGKLNIENEATKQYLEESNKEIYSYAVDKNRYKKRNKMLFGISFILDIIICILFLKLFKIISVFGIVASILYFFYRLIVLKTLLYKSSMMWQFAYIPIIGFIMYFELGFIKIETHIKNAWMMFLVPFILLAYLIAYSNMDSDSIFGKIILIIVNTGIIIYTMTHILKIHNRICNGICYRFNKDEKFKKKLVYLFPIYILKIAFGKELGKTNFEEFELDKL